MQQAITKGEHDLMMGHINNDMTSLYVHADLNSIQDKLDRYGLGGLTFAEALKTLGAISMHTSISGRPKAIPFEDVGKGKGMRFQSEDEMNKYVALLKKRYAESGFPPVALNDKLSFSAVLDRYRAAQGALPYAIGKPHRYVQAASCACLSHTVS